MDERPDVPKQTVGAPKPLVTEPERGQDAPSTPKKHRRRWLRYSLRTFFLLVTVACVWLGFLVYRVSKQKEVVRWVSDHGGWIDYDFEWDEETQAHDGEAKPPGPGWLRDLIGIDYMADPVAIACHDKAVTDIRPLQHLPELQYLSLYRTSVSDLGPLRELTELRELSLFETPVTDLEPLRELTKLRWLILLDTPVSELGCLRELKQLRGLDLTDTNVTDVSPLSELTELELLSLKGTAVKDLTPLAGLKKVKIYLWDDQQVKVPKELEGRVIWE